MSIINKICPGENYNSELNRYFNSSDFKSQVNKFNDEQEFILALMVGEIDNIKYNQISISDINYSYRYLSKQFLLYLKLDGTFNDVRMMSESELKVFDFLTVTGGEINNLVTNVENKLQILSSYNTSKAKADIIDSFVKDAKNRIEEFQKGELKPFKNFEEDNYAAIQLLLQNRTTNMLWKSIAVTLITGGAAIIYGIFQAVKINGNSFLFYNKEPKSYMEILQADKLIDDLFTK